MLVLFCQNQTATHFCSVEKPDFVSPRWGSKRWNALLSGGFHPRLLWYDPSGVLKIHLFYRVSILDFFTGFEKSISAKKSKFQTAEYSLREDLIWCQAGFGF
jgi:hypothetical protein